MCACTCAYACCLHLCICLLLALCATSVLAVCLCAYARELVLRWRYCPCARHTYVFGFPEMREMPVANRELLVKKYLSQFGKSFDVSQMSTIINAPQTGKRAVYIFTVYTMNYIFGFQIGCVSLVRACECIFDYYFR